MVRCGAPRATSSLERGRTSGFASAMSSEVRGRSEEEEETVHSNGMGVAEKKPEREKVLPVVSSTLACGEVPDGTDACALLAWCVSMARGWRVAVVVVTRAPLSATTSHRGAVEAETRERRSKDSDGGEGGRCGTSCEGLASDDVLSLFVASLEESGDGEEGNESTVRDGK